MATYYINGETVPDGRRTDHAVYRPHTVTGPIRLTPNWRIGIPPGTATFQVCLRREGWSGLYSDYLYWTKETIGTRRLFMRNGSSGMPGGSLPTGAGYIRYALTSRLSISPAYSFNGFAWKATLEI